MTDKISMARQKLRDYAREPHEVDLPVRPEGMERLDSVRVAIPRGEVGGKAFVAVQEVLRVAEELRAESREPVTTKVEVHGRSIPYPPDSAYKDALAAAADRIEATIFLALG